MPSLLFFYFICHFNCGYADQKQTLLAIGCGHISLFSEELRILHHSTLQWDIGFYVFILVI